ncbi:unnamed protein product [Closterium sp. NIES-64]|nr:unnamed protein product [Closterium sp. NIES-64]
MLRRRALGAMALLVLVGVAVVLSSYTWSSNRNSHSEAESSSDTPKLLLAHILGLPDRKCYHNSSNSGGPEGGLITERGGGGGRSEGGAAVAAAAAAAAAATAATVARGVGRAAEAALLRDELEDDAGGYGECERVRGAERMSSPYIFQPSGYPPWIFPGTAAAAAATAPTNPHDNQTVAGAEEEESAAVVAWREGLDKADLKCENFWGDGYSEVHTLLGTPPVGTFPHAPWDEGSGDGEDGVNGDGGNADGGNGDGGSGDGGSADGGSDRAGGGAGGGSGGAGDGGKGGGGGGGEGGQSGEKWVAGGNEENGGDGWLRCIRNPTLDSSVCEAGMLGVFPDKMLMARGGEDVRSVMGRIEEEEYPMCEEGAFQVEQRPVLLVTRYEYVNLYHTSTDWQSAFHAMRLLHISVRPLVVFLDAHAKGNLDEAWATMFGPYRFIKEYQPHLPPGTAVCFHHAVFVPVGYASPIFHSYVKESVAVRRCVADTAVQGGKEWGVTPFGSTSRITEFAEFLIKSHGIGLHTGPWSFPLLPAPPPGFLPSHRRRRQQNGTLADHDSTPRDPDTATGAADAGGGAASASAAAAGLTRMEFLWWRDRAVAGPSVVNQLGYFPLVDWGKLGDGNPAPQQQGQQGQEEGGQRGWHLLWKLEGGKEGEREEDRQVEQLWEERQRMQPWWQQQQREQEKQEKQEKQGKPQEQEQQQQQAGLRKILEQHEQQEQQQQQRGEQEPVSLNLLEQAVWTRPVRVLVIRRDFFLAHPRMEDNGWVEERVEGVNDLVRSLKQWAWERGGLRLLDAAERVDRMGSVVGGGNWWRMNGGSGRAGGAVGSLRVRGGKGGGRRRGREGGPSGDPEKRTATGVGRRRSGHEEEAQTEQQEREKVAG